MCGLKVGDEVVHVGGAYDTNQIAAYGSLWEKGLGVGAIVERIWFEQGYFRMWVSGQARTPVGLDPRHWRKVQRRDLTVWLSTAAPADHLDKRRITEPA